MPSLRSRLFVLLLRHRNIARLQRGRTTRIDWSTSIPHLRQEVERSARVFGNPPKGFRLSPVAIGELGAEWMLPPHGAMDRAILYFHGGGMVLGSVRAHRGIVGKVVKGSGVGALAFDYGLAPEHPFPAALNDSLAAHRHLIARGIDPSHIVFMGDSAGGGLCLAALLALRDSGVPLPAAAVTLSPWTDLTNSGESLSVNEGLDVIGWRDAAIVFSKYYVGDNDPAHPWISPLNGDLHGLPSLLIYAGSHEMLRDDSTRFAAKAKSAGVDVTLRVGEGLFHCYPACSPYFPEAREAMEEICRFIRARIGDGRE